ncbi:hypothetical protein [Acutalibacter sp. 1XD8-36]|uniref:hypothetical protein n=1 Tax=Acutalibacter sp. 1XD8-36 TaxID=2320852 RepID=UPI0014127279|nr:hypothetical protein [Acutalibacter sp. 1XD8-36]NBJ88336.1 hypothetical protein [Acutalibacter sp. 1XD8-36]
MNIFGKDLEILRDLVKQQKELALSPEMDRLREDWRAHGSFKNGSRPMVTIELGTFAGDIIPDLMRCQGEEARKLEWELLGRMVNHKLFGDDSVIPAYMPVTIPTSFVPFGLPVTAEHAIDTQGEDLGHHFNAQISDLEEDFHKLGPSVYSVYPEEARKRQAELEELFGDILSARLVGHSLYFCPTQDIVHIMSMEDMFFAMYDYPELFHKMMEMLSTDYIAFMDLMERENILLPTTAEEHLAQGSYCFTDELPASADGPLTTRDVWGYMDSQESAGISPEMYEEFVFPYYEKVSERFGLYSYGCCEAVDPFWDRCLSKARNLRKLSISPWCNEEKMGEILKDRKTVYLRKPSPNLLGVGSELEEDAVREHFCRTAKAASGCKLEIAQRDVYHINNTPEKVKRYVQLIREILEDNWKP